MKKIMLYFLLALISATSFCQKNNDSVPPVQKDYLKKSKHQKTAAWILLGGGTALMATGIIVGSGKDAYLTDAAGGAAVAGIGLLSTIASIPLFIVSGKNKRKANTMSGKVKIENGNFFQKQSFVHSSYPAVALKINL